MEPLPFRNLSRFEQEIKRMPERLPDRASRDPTRRVSQKSTGSFLFRTLAILRRNRLPMTSSSVQLYRTILVADIVMLGLYPTIDWRGHLRRFLQDLSVDLIQTAVKEPLTSPYTGFRLAQPPMAAADTIEWVMRRLPDIGRQTMRTLSAGERLIPHTLRLLRRAAVLGDHRRGRARRDQARRLVGERVWAGSCCASRRTPGRRSAPAALAAWC